MAGYCMEGLHSMRTPVLGNFWMRSCHGNISRREEGFTPTNTSMGSEHGDFEKSRASRPRIRSHGSKPTVPAGGGVGDDVPAGSRCCGTGGAVAPVGSWWSVQP